MKRIYIDKNFACLIAGLSSEQVGKMVKFAVSEAFGVDCGVCENDIAGYGSMFMQSVREQINKSNELSRKRSDCGRKGGRGNRTDVDVKNKAIAFSECITPNVNEHLKKQNKAIAFSAGDVNSNFAESSQDVENQQVAEEKKQNKAIAFSAEITSQKSSSDYIYNNTVDSFSLSNLYNISNTNNIFNLYIYKDIYKDIYISNSAEKKSKIENNDVMMSVEEKKQICQSCKDKLKSYAQANVAKNSKVVKVAGNSVCKFEVEMFAERFSKIDNQYATVNAKLDKISSLLENVLSKLDVVQAGNVEAIDKTQSITERKKAELAKKEEMFYNELVPFVDTYGSEMIREFYDYWTERTKSGISNRKEGERTWNTERRLAVWAKNCNKYNNKNLSENGTKKEKSDFDRLRRGFEVEANVDWSKVSETF